MQQLLSVALGVAISQDKQLRDAPPVIFVSTRLAKGSKITPFSVSYEVILETLESIKYGVHLYQWSKASQE